MKFGAWWHCQYGRLLLLLKRYDRAEREFLAALRADPSHLSAIGSLGLLYGTRGRYPLAIEQFRAALRLQPPVPG